jgi:phosphoribosyl-dephospho-CoA transferase
MPASDDLVSLLAGVAAIAASAPMRIDGEIVGAAGGVNWAELEAEGSGDILVKASDGMRMMARAAFLAGGSAS